MIKNVLIASSLAIMSTTLLSNTPNLTNFFLINQPSNLSIKVELKNESSKTVICKKLAVKAPISTVSECGFSTISNSPFSLLVNEQPLTFKPGQTKPFPTAGLMHILNIQSQYLKTNPNGGVLRYCQVDGIISDCSYTCEANGRTYTAGDTWYEDIREGSKLAGKQKLSCKTDGTSFVAGVTCSDGYRQSGETCVPRGCPNRNHREKWDAPGFGGIATYECKYGEKIPLSLDCTKNPVKNKVNPNNKWQCVAQCSNGLYENENKFLRNPQKNGKYKQACYGDASLGVVSGSLVCDSGYQKRYPTNLSSIECKAKSCSFQNGTIPHGGSKSRTGICSNGIQDLTTYRCSLGKITTSVRQRSCNNGPVTD